MAQRESCYNCVFSRCDPEAWLRAAWRDEPMLMQCANHPWWPGRLHDATGTACRNYRPKPAEPNGDSVRWIPLGEGFYAYVDAADYEWLSQWNWQMCSAGYPARHEKHKCILMHRQIMQPAKGMVVDHIDGNKANACRFNLRVCTRWENMCNQRKHTPSSSKFKGVSYSRHHHKWRARIWFLGKPISLGLFAKEAEAARAYDRAAVEYFGEFANLNFPQEWPAERRAEVYAQRDAAKRRAEGGGRRTAGTREGKRKRVKGKSTKAKDKTARTGGRKGRKVAAGGKPGTARRVKPKGGKPAVTRRRSPPSNRKGRTKADKSSGRSRRAARKSLRGG